MDLIRYPSRWLDKKTAGLAKSRFLSYIAIQYYCAASGVIFSIMFFLAFVAADFIALIKPWWNAEETANHY